MTAARPDTGQSLPAGLHSAEPGWAAPGIFRVAPGVHRIPLPLPLPNDALRAVNVYAIEDGDGLVLVDSGWALAEARSRLEAALAELGHGLGDVCRFLITHVHRDHYTQAVALRREFGVRISLGIGDSTHARVDALLAHHAARLDATDSAVAQGASTAHETARLLTWTRRERPLGDLDPFNQMLAVLETGAHLDLVVMRGSLRAVLSDGVTRYCAR